MTRCVVVTFSSGSDDDNYDDSDEREYYYNNNSNIEDDRQRRRREKRVFVDDSVSKKAGKCTYMWPSTNRETLKPFDVHCCHMLPRHPLPDRAKPSFVIFDIRAL